ncbi:MAG TPA: hypothetical protein VIH57_05755 [Bacteroidales bacterium]
MSREETMEEMVARRNKWLLRFFTMHGYDVRIVGDAQKPAVVLNDMAVLSCYVKNFDLHFTKEPFSDEIVKSFKLKAEIEVSKLELQEAIELCTHRPVYKIKLTGTDMFLVGYNYLNSEEAMGRYPVFAKHKPKVYFDKEYTVKLVESLRKEQYSVEIV